MQSCSRRAHLVMVEKVKKKFAEEALKVELLLLKAKELLMKAKELLLLWWHSLGAKEV